MVRTVSNHPPPMPANPAELRAIQAASRVAEAAAIAKSDHLAQAAVDDAAKESASPAATPAASPSVDMLSVLVPYADLKRLFSASAAAQAAHAQAVGSQLQQGVFVIDASKIARDLGMAFQAQRKSLRQG